MLMTGSSSAAPKVSIGMPVYNGAAYVCEALDSLLAQTYRDFELIISDNASTDGTRSICEGYASRDPRIRYVRQPENIGAVGNFRYVLSEARGEYFMWAAHDDFWFPEFVDACLSKIRDSDDAAFVVTKYYILSRFSFLLSRYFPPDLSFVTSEDPRFRVLTYSSLPFHSHKDNLVYALWHRQTIVRIISQAETALKRTVIGGPVNEYALSLAKGAFIDEVLFLKKYRSSVPGHPLNPFLGLILRALPRSKRRSPIADRSAAERHLLDIVALLRFAKFDDDFVRSVACAHKSYLDHDLIKNVTTSSREPGLKTVREHKLRI